MKKVLLIEDDAILRENTSELLELSNYEVITASNGKIGLNKAIKMLPDIIVCDILMPEMDGYSVFQELTKHSTTKHIPFVFLSAKTERQDIRKGMNMGADDYLTKPFNEEELINTIESRIAKAAILKEEREISQGNVHNNVEEIQTLNDLKAFLEKKGALLNYKQDDIVYKEGENSNLIYLVLKGIIKCYKLDEQGKELITDLYKENDLFGYTSFTQNIPYQETATAIKNAQVISISKSELKDILNKNHKVTLELMQLLTDSLKGMKDQLLQMAYSSVHKKTASTILKFAEKLNHKPEDPISISRSDLASVAGIATETLIRTMSNFKKQGIIEIEGRNIKIVDIEKLQYIC
ncbi:response regulator [Tenacibaculum caenipelagi]|uniref:CRP-like cAMP-binding protein n=1 Tax=Tenacibaculum caenipelagi TaxID=1325435 RepID=A0A4R6TCP0_9FLAO|nr:response regulator [Tenacibaculum caenipelagi]TDQ21955.1 CRP-like cAMP-binding protein [Tenacibaculum caenipelagi]